MQKLPLTYCHRCQCNHDFGKHRGTPSAKLPAHLAQTPIASALHSYKGGSQQPQVRAAQSYIPFVVQNRMLLQPQKKRREGPFDKRNYQRLLMADRREADILGFGGSKQPGHPEFNPKYKTVGQFRAWKAQQPKEPVIVES
jgi:hypothetical protein